MFNRIIKKFKKIKKRKTEDLSPILRSEHALSTDGDGKGGDVVFMDPPAQKSLKSQQPQSANGVPEKVPENCPEVISELPRTRLSSIQGQPEMAVDILIEAFAVKHFFKGTLEDLQLSIHLREVQEAISCDVLKLVPPPKEACLLKRPQECYCQRIFKHLHQILIYIRTTKLTFTLLEWVVQSCSSQEFIGHPNFNDEALQKPAIILLSNFLSLAEEKVLPIIQEEMSTLLTRILQNEAHMRDIESYSGNEEEFVALYVDAIQCIDAMRKRALKISSTFKTRVEMVCFHELQKFVQMYISAAKKHNRKQTKTDKTILMHSFKTFNNCAELKQYVQMTGENINNNLHSPQIISALENMETSVLKRVLKTLNRQTEISIKSYFKKGGYMGKITADIKELLDPMPDHWKTQVTLINKAYESIVMLYLTCLVQSNPARVKKMWSDVCQRVCQDSQLLDDMFQSLNQNVERRNFILLNVGNILNCSSIDSIKLITAHTVRECPTVSVDLIKALLRWKGITSPQLQDVIEVCQDVSETYTRPRRWNCCCL